MAVPGGDATARLTTRVLPPDEWQRLPEADLPALLAYVAPEDVQVMVVEDRGQIVGCWAVLRMTHVEGLWIAPEYRGHVGVARRLLTATVRAARAWAHGWVMTGATTPQITTMLMKMGAVRIPMETYVMPIGAR